MNHDNDMMVMAGAYHAASTTELFQAAEAEVSQLEF
jgi:hypothetical protein